ncbi:ROK family transcriptional regulator [Tranquillimonas alkanivorans]|uniref:Sugar kinase of the NBD/HSP70 family, may contain an N-terminal HTH domain n=1 Tax=Tranquillimonas alkanivorans TaxID=441119 RepID=A0A1I5WJI4_9RHOB|nr:ROK family transcriptional regulator [Tranquillimonas alkanivorans]SFQ19820.1 Sugar kinase of the NBD/HSP70 family, may contain an N-terminal HTH domain [Tranquillimonas alkanivorans]
MLSILPPRSTSAERARSHNRRLVLGHVHATGEIGRAELSRACGLTIQAVSNIIAELEQEGLIRETGRRSTGRGLPATLYGINPGGACALGVEVRPDALLAALLDLNGGAIFTTRRALNDAHPTAVTQELRALREELKSAHPDVVSRLLGAGVVMPGPFGATGLSGTASDLPGWQETDARQVFAEALGVPIDLDNDANAAAMAERVKGVAQGLNDYAYLYFGTGVGLGLVSGGRRVAGAFGNAGEIGHLRVQTPDGSRALEELASRLSLQHRLAGRGHGTINFDRLSALDAAGDAILEEWIATAASALGQAVHVIENLFDPETVILGGALPERIVDRLISRVPLPDGSVSNRPDRVRARLLRGDCGRLTATLGAAALILDRAFSPQLGALD